MKNIFLFCAGLLLTVGILTGCKTTNPNTGEKEFDQVKTEQVKAIIKPQVATAVTLLIHKRPDIRPYFVLAAENICALRDAGSLSPAFFQAAINSAFAEYPDRVDPLVVAGINTVIALVEINYANRLNADLPPEEFVWNLFDVVCEGIQLGLAPSAPPE